MAVLLTAPNPARTDAGAGCAQDASTLCRGTEGRQQMLACLRRNLDRLSLRCLEELAEAAATAPLPPVDSGSTPDEPEDPGG